MLELRMKHNQGEIQLNYVVGSTYNIVTTLIN